MVLLSWVCFLLSLSTSCQGDDAGFPVSGGDADGGTSDSAGADEYGRDAPPEAAAACADPLMFRTGGFCIDARPALIATGVQRDAVSWNAASETCVARGARLCTEEERESSCAAAGDKADFCSGPADTWEWSAGSCSTTTYRRSACCNAAAGFRECSTKPSTRASYHCCSPN